MGWLKPQTMLGCSACCKLGVFTFWTYAILCRMIIILAALHLCGGGTLIKQFSGAGLRQSSLCQHYVRSVMFLTSGQEAGWCNQLC